MNPRIVSRYTGWLVGIVGVLLLAPTAMAVYEGESRTIVAYVATMTLAFAIAFALWRFGRDASLEEIHRKDAFGVVTFTWFALGFVGGLPFVLEGSIPDPAGALFEAVSGFTTTGATVVSNVDALTRATNLWRCLMHWMGGMGIVVFFVAVFPQLGVGAKHLFRTEVAGPISGGLRPKIRQTATALWWIYGGLTALCTVLLVAAGMPLYDAICHAMSTLGTGGYSTKSASVGFWQDNSLIHWIIIVFMLLAGLNFGLYYDLLRGRWRDFYRNYELRFYLTVNAVVVAIVAATYVSPTGEGRPILETVRHATFQTLAVTTTTGFMTEDWETYAPVAQFALFACMFMGACAGSTAGGLKASRVFILGKAIFLELGSLVRPHVVTSLRIGRGTVPNEIVRSVLIFFGAFILVFLTTSVLLMGMNLPVAAENPTAADRFVTATSATIACLSSVGPGFGGVGPTANFGAIPAVGKVLLSLCMIAGRLELFVLFAVFSPECWRR